MSVVTVSATFLLVTYVWGGGTPDRGDEAAAGRSGDHVLEPAKRVPVVYDADVVVAGGGISGVFAALAAAEQGATTVLIERFGTVGGSFGPGMNSQEGALKNHPGEFHKGAPNESVKGDVTALPKKFADRFFALHAGRKSRFMADTSMCSYVALTMLEEAGVRMLLSCYACDPILEGDRVCGLFVENKSGRQAVRATVVIDATGEADVCRRAGAGILQPKGSSYELDHHSPTGVGIWALIGGVDRAKLDWEKAREISWEQDIAGLARVNCGGVRDVGPDRHQVAIKAQLVRPHPKVDMGDAQHVSALESGMRRYCFEYAEKLRKHVPGAETAYLLFIGPYLGCRGGPCVEGEYTLTVGDLRAGRKFDDVIYVYGEPRALRWQAEQKVPFAWGDVPYRVMIPQRIDGLIAVGRSASGIPDTLLRNREGVMYMGQAGGTAAAMCAKRGIQPRTLKGKELQKKLLEAGFYLGDEKRLAELGLGEAGTDTD
jgi:ribulose 1,5-bisphosphate synthetase/thiazole synthase